MSLTPLQITGFPGLSLQDDPEDVGVGGALNARNVDLSRPGRLTTREGAVQFDTSGAVGFMYELYPYYSDETDPQMVIARDVATGVNFYAMTNAGAITLLGSDTTGSGHTSGGRRPGTGTSPIAMDSAAVGTPTSTLLFITLPLADGSGNRRMQKYDGTTLTQCAASAGFPTYVAVTPWDNRLAQGRYPTAAGSPSGADGSRSTVFFSDPGAPETYGANSFVDLQPGDGEAITGMVAWREQLFVFKESNVFVFYGTSTDADGNPIFNYRRVSLPSRVRDNTAGLIGPKRAMAAGPDGVYFLADNGIYVTAGDTPQLFSAALTPIFQGTADTSLKLTGTSTALHYADQRLILSYSATTQNQLLVHDFRSGQWAVWEFAGGASPPESYVEWAPDTGDIPRIFAVAGLGAHVWQFSPTATVDAGATTISWSYQSGWYDLGVPEQEKVVRQSHLSGTGTVTLSRFADFGTTDANAAVLTLGSTATDTARQGKAWRGTLLSHQLSGSGAAVVTSLVHDIGSVRPVGVRS